MRVGILGGTFNPPHIGHLICAQEAWWQLDLDRVLLMPAGQAPHKEIERDPGPEQRHQLCVLAASGSEWMEVSRQELDRPGPSYTVDTLAALHDAAPGDDLVFIAGADQIAAFESWRQPATVLTLATVAVAERDRVSRSEVRRAIAGIERSDRVVFFPMPRIDVSSTEVRTRISTGRPYRFLVPPAVADRIEKAGLYEPGIAS